MHHSYSMFSTVFNIIVIFAIFNIVAKAIKKSKAANQKGNNPSNEKPQTHETVIKSTPPAKNLKYENKLIDTDKLQLKRCSNCGGEIPLTMMKCDLCGTLQAGCGLVSILIILLVITAVGLFIAKDAGVPVMYYIQQIFRY